MWRITGEMASKTYSVHIPHLGMEFEACLKSNRRGLDPEKKMKMIAIWHDDDGNEVQITSEKSFNTFLKMPQKIITIKRDQEDALKIVFELHGKKHVVYSFANTYSGLLEDLDGSFGIRFPNDDHRMFWVDSEGDSFDVTNEKSFELFLKYGSRQLQVLSISKETYEERNVPTKVIFTRQSMVRKQYIDCVMDWNSLLRELELTFGIKFTTQEYRLYWKDDENDDLEITDDSSFHIFVEKSNSHRIFIVEKPKPPTVKVYFMRLGERNHKVYYWGVGNYAHFLARMKKDLSVDPDDYKIFDTDNGRIEDDDDFTIFLNSAADKMKIYIEPEDEADSGQKLSLAIKPRY